MSRFDRLGGEPVLRSLIDQFVDRVFDDTMIGFLFRNSNRKRVKALEYEHAAEHLGAGTPYTGRPLRAAHQPHRIAGGQFERRAVLLRNTLSECGVPEDIQHSWLAHNQSLRSVITGDEAGQCALGPDSPALRVLPTLPTRTKDQP